MSNMKYKKGDTVLIDDDLMRGESCGVHCVDEPMSRRVGQTGVVVCVNGDHYEIKFADGGTLRFWTDEMIQCKIDKKSKKKEKEKKLKTSVSLSTKHIDLLKRISKSSGKVKNSVSHGIEILCEIIKVVEKCDDIIKNIKNIKKSIDFF